MKNVDNAALRASIDSLRNVQAEVASALWLVGCNANLSDTARSEARAILTDIEHRVISAQTGLAMVDGYTPKEVSA